MSGRQIIGLLTDRDCRQAMPSSDVSLSVEEILAKLDFIRIDTCLTVPIVIVPPKVDSVEAARQLPDQEFDCLPVVQHDQLVGILTATDFLRRFLAAASLTDAGIRVRDDRQTPPLIVTPSDHVRTAYHRMRCAHIRHLACIVKCSGLRKFRRKS